MPGAGLVMIEAEFILGGLELSSIARRRPSIFASLSMVVPSDAQVVKKASSPSAMLRRMSSQRSRRHERGVVVARIEIGEFEISPVVQPLAHPPISAPMRMRVICKQFLSPFPRRLVVRPTSKRDHCLSRGAHNADEKQRRGQRLRGTGTAEVKKTRPPGPGLVFQSRFNRSRFGDDRGRGIEIKVIVQSDADNVSLELAADQACAVHGGARLQG